MKYKEKNWTILKKKDFLGQKNKLGLSFRRKKSIFWVKNWEKFENKVQKLTDFKEEKDISGQKKQAGAELKKKKWFRRE